MLVGGHGKAGDQVFCAARRQFHCRDIALGQTGRELLGRQGRLANLIGITGRNPRFGQLGGSVRLDQRGRGAHHGVGAMAGDPQACHPALFAGNIHGNAVFEAVVFDAHALDGQQPGACARRRQACTRMGLWVHNA